MRFEMSSTITWLQTLGDPDLWGWSVTIAYAAVALLAFAALVRARRANDRCAAFNWGMISAGSAALGANKQLDLHMLCIQVAREVAYKQGWYGGRRAWQGAFVAFGLVAAAVAAAIWLRRSGSFPRRSPLAVAGMALLAVYVVLRMTVVNHVLPTAAFTAFGMPVLAGIESLALVTLGVAALRYPQARPLRAGEVSGVAR